MFKQLNSLLSYDGMYKAQEEVNMSPIHKQATAIVVQMFSKMNFIKLVSKIVFKPVLHYAFKLHILHVSLN